RIPRGPTTICATTMRRSGRMVVSSRRPNDRARQARIMIVPHPLGATRRLRYHGPTQEPPMNARQLMAAAAATALAAAAHAQTSVSVDMTNASIPSSGSTPDIVRTSSPNTINAATGYTFSFNPVVHGSGFLGLLLVPNNTPLADVLNTFYAGGYHT